MFRKNKGDDKYYCAGMRPREEVMEGGIWGEGDGRRVRQSGTINSVGLPVSWVNGEQVR